jgi:DNA polymerase-1
MEADISQCELRVLAHFSQDARLLEAYAAADVDVHRWTAAAVLGVREDQVSDEQRNTIGKRVNFAVIYGMTAEGLSDELDVSVGEAEYILSAYFNAYPGVKQWADSVHEFVRTHGHVRTLLGRRRQLPGVWSADQGTAARALRQSVNTIIQGTAADLMKLALVRLHNVLPPEVRMLLTCHDSALLEVPELIIENTRRETIATMSAGFPGFSVPIRVDVGIGKTWAECKEQN